MAEVHPTPLDESTRLQELKALVREFCSERGWDPFHTPKDLAIGLSTEAAELLEIYRFKNEAEVATDLKSPKMREAISHELSDCLFFLLRFSDLYGFDLSQGLREKLVVNARKYPVGSATHVTEPDATL